MICQVINTLIQNTNISLHSLTDKSASADIAKIKLC